MPGPAVPTEAPAVLADRPPSGARLAGSVDFPRALLAGVVHRAPPPELHALLEWVAAGRPLYLYLPP